MCPDFSFQKNFEQAISVADPDPNDPYVLGLLDLDSDPVVRGTDPDPTLDPSIIKQI
jgi:hypothetical protein